MITQLRLKRFKSFADATLELGPFTLPVSSTLPEAKLPSRSVKA
jgi:hypothetical protein